MSPTGAASREFSVENVLWRSFSVLIQNIAPAGLVALAMFSLPYVLGSFLGFGVDAGPVSDFEIGEWLWKHAVVAILSLFLLSCLEAVLAPGVYETLQGHCPSARALVLGGLTRFPAVLAVVLVATVPEAVPEALWIALSIVGPRFPLPDVTLMYFFAIALGIFLFLAVVFLYVAIPAATVEGLGAMRSIERSVRLVRRNVFRIIGLLVAVTFLFVTVFLVFSPLVDWARTVLPATAHHFLVWLDLLLVALGAALWAVVATVAYHDLRLSLDGSDETGGSRRSGPPSRSRADRVRSRVAERSP